VIDIARQSFLPYDDEVCCARLRDNKLTGKMGGRSPFDACRVRPGTPPELFAKMVQPLGYLFCPSLIAWRIQLRQFFILTQRPTGDADQQRIETTRNSCCDADTIFGPLVGIDSYHNGRNCHV